MDSQLELVARLKDLHEKFNHILEDLPNVSMYRQDQYVTMLTKKEVEDLTEFLSTFLYE